MSRTTYIRGEILPPLSKSNVAEKPSSDLTSNEDLNYITTWLDDRFVNSWHADSFRLGCSDWLDPRLRRCPRRIRLDVHRCVRMEARRRTHHSPSNDAEPDDREYFRSNPDCRGLRTRGLESESPQLQSAHPRPAFRTPSHVARLVICRQCLPADLPVVSCSSRPSRLSLPITSLAFLRL